MATYSATMSGDSRYSITLTVYEMSYDISRNSSIVHWKLEATKSSGSGYYSSDAKNPMHTVINGTTDGWNVTYDFRNQTPKTLLFLEAEREIFHNTDGSKTINVEGFFQDKANGLGSATATGTLTLTKIPRYATANQSLNSKTETSIKMNWSSDSTIDYIWYSTNNGANWTAVGSVNATSGSYTISGLNANTTYNIKTRVRRKDSQLTTDSSNLAIATYNWPNCTSAPNFTVGNSVTLQFYNPLNRQINIRLWSYTSQDYISDSMSISGTSYTFTPDASTLYASIPNNKSSQYTVDVFYNSHKETRWNAGTYSVDENTNKPTFSDFDYEDTNATTLALTGDNQTAILGYSNIRVTIPVSMKATAKNGASMSKYQFKIGNTVKDIAYSDDEAVYERIDNITSGEIVVYAIDSRNISTPVTKSVTSLKQYTDIARGNISITRQDNVGETVTLAFNGTFWNDSFGDVTNSITNVIYRFKKTTDSNWTTGATTITPSTSGNNYSFNGAIAGDTASLGFDAGSSYNIEVTVSDELSSTTFTTTLGSGSPNIAFVENGVSLLGKYDESDTTNKVQINGNTKVNGNIDATTIYNMAWDYSTNNTTDTWIPVSTGSGSFQHRILPNPLFPIGTIYETTVNTNPGSWFGGTWTEIVEPILVAWYVQIGGTVKEKKNINTITNDGRGTYQINFSKNMANTNYIPCITAEVGGMGQEIIGVYSKNVNNFKFDITNFNGSGVVASDLNIAIFGVLATKERYVWKRTA